MNGTPLKNETASRQIKKGKETWTKINVKKRILRMPTDGSPLSMPGVLIKNQYKHESGIKLEKTINYNKEIELRGFWCATKS